MTSTVKQTFDRDGYVLVSNLVPADMLSDLRSACDRVVAKTRAGKWPHRRVVGKQFPPYGDGNPDSWGVQHVMHPELGEPIFARWYASDGLVSAATDLLECEEEDLQMGGYWICARRLCPLTIHLSSPCCRIVQSPD